MAEYIEKNVAIARLTALEIGNPCATMTDAKRQIADTRPADVAPVVHGRWISYLDGDHIMPNRYYRCSRCGRVESRRQPYCHCGAKMDGGDES
nr:MAG TPA: DNA-directed RNA polymerase [Bacteriophage sp.]